MKSNLVKLFFLIIIFPFFNCSSSNGESICGEVLEPIGNEFTLNCAAYATQHGRLNINYSVAIGGTSSCRLELINSPYDDFNPLPGDENINYIAIWLVVPSESYSIQDIPTGTYRLKKLNPGEDHIVMDIVDYNTIAFQGSVYQPASGSPLFSPQNSLGAFDDITVSIEKNDTIYTVNYYMKSGNKIIKGKFIGELPIIDNWN